MQCAKRRKLERGAFLCLVLTVLVQSNMKALFIQYKCCCECGLPIKVDGQKLHGDGLGRLCTMTKFFLMKLCTSAEDEGLQPVNRLRQLLRQGGTASLITEYASFVSGAHKRIRLEAVAATAAVTQQQYPQQQQQQACLFQPEQQFLQQQQQQQQRPG